MKALLAAAALGLAVAPAFAQTDTVTRSTYTYAKVGGAALKADVYRSATSPYGDRRPAVVFIHGGGWTCGNRNAFEGWPKRLAEAYGVVTVTVSYRLAPITNAVLGSDGRIAQPGERDGCDKDTPPSDDLGLPANRAPFPAQVNDLRSFMWSLRTHADALQVDRHRIALIGASAGGHLAAALAAVDAAPATLPAGFSASEVYSRPNALVTVAGPWNLATTQALPDPSVPGILRNLFGGESTAAQRAAASPTGYLPGGTSPVSGRPFPPTLFLHGSADTLVPPQQSIEACGRMAGTCAHGQALVVTSEAGKNPHDALFLMEARYTELIAFLAQTIGRNQ